ACLRNGLASPSTLGVSNAASFGANIAIFIAFGTGHSSRNDFLYVSQSPWVTSAFALVFSLLCLFLVMAFSAFAHFKPTSVLLIGVSFSSLFQALTTLLQYFADDVQLSSVTNWAFGDLERLDFAQNGIIGGIALACLIIAFFFSYPLNAMQGGEDLAKSLGVKTSIVRFILLFLSSLLTAVCVCFCGIIGFIGIMAPHILKRFVGNDMRLLLPASFLGGAGLLLICDILTRLIGRGTSLPVGAITALVGAPFFLFLLFSKKEKNL
ncbi:MAG: FecCD family ABC transporter permease, partial [Candidatus Enteromonas sp.]